MKFYNKISRKRLIGLVIIFLGLAALVTPFTPGAAFFIFLGMQLLGIHIVFLDKIEHKLGIDRLIKKQ